MKSLNCFQGEFCNLSNVDFLYLNFNKNRFYGNLDLESKKFKGYIQVSLKTIKTLVKFEN